QASQLTQAEAAGQVEQGHTAWASGDDILEQVLFAFITSQQNGKAGTLQPGQSGRELLGTVTARCGRGPAMSHYPPFLRVYAQREQVSSDGLTVRAARAKRELSIVSACTYMGDQIKLTLYLVTNTDARLGFGHPI